MPRGSLHASYFQHLMELFNFLCIGPLFLIHVVQPYRCSPLLSEMDFTFGLSFFLSFWVIPKRKGWGSETFALCHLITSSLGHVVILDYSAKDFEKSSVSHSCLQAPQQTVLRCLCQAWSDGLFPCVFPPDSDKSDSALSVASMKRFAFHSFPYPSPQLLSG